MTPCTAVMLLLGACGSGAVPLPAAVPAAVVEVIDGDTVRVAASPWPGIVAVVDVRLAGIDTPELHGACESERTAAAAAREKVAGWLPAGAAVTVVEPQRDKYAGRVVAQLTDEHGRDIGKALLEEGVARVYAGGKRGGWCGGE